MPNSLMICLSCKVILLFVILMVANGASSSEDKTGLKKLSIAKRSFLSRERNYLKDRPISPDLKSFIKRFRRTAPDLKRDKRQDELKEQMFVIKNGEIEPLSNATDFTNQQLSDSFDFENFTVIPLIIPITIPRFTNATVCDTDAYTTEEQKKIELSNTSEGSSWTLSSKEKVEVVTTTNTYTKSSNQAKVDSPVKHNAVPTELVADDAIETSTENELLNKILTDVQELIYYEKGGKSANRKEGAMCSITGDWDSYVGGMQIQMYASNDTHNIDPVAKVTQQIPDAEDGFLRTGNWTLTVKMPYRHSSFIMLTAISERIMAVFIGDCRICEGVETIIGAWMLARRSTSCRDREQTHSFKNDVLRRCNIRRLQRDHRRAMTSTSSNLKTD